MEIQNQVRGYTYVLGVIKSQQNDPFCSGCNALVNTVNAAQENLRKFSVEQAATLRSLPEQFSRQFVETMAGYASFKLPESTVGQKKAGNCRLPEGVCFVKSSLALLQKV